MKMPCSSRQGSCHERLRLIVPEAILWRTLFASGPSTVSNFAVLLLMALALAPEQAAAVAAAVARGNAKDGTIHVRAG
jgi:hypothetical protein